MSKKISPVLPLSFYNRQLAKSKIIVKKKQDNTFKNILETTLNKKGKTNKQNRKEKEE